MCLIHNWRKCWRRYSTWLLALIGGLSISDLIGFMPSIQEYIEPQTYKFIMFGLSIATFVALQIRQTSVSGPKT